LSGSTWHWQVEHAHFTVSAMASLRSKPRLLL
jgi:hypothetical protein